MLSTVRSGQPITADSYNRLVDAVNQLLRISGSFPIEIRRHPAGFQIGLAYQEREAVVELTTTLSSGGSATAKILHWQADDWTAADTAPIEVCDAIGSFEGNAGDRALCRFHRQSGRWIVWQLEC